MSAIAGILSLDGSPVDPTCPGKMAEAMEARSPDGIRTWMGGPLGLAHGHFWTTPEEVGEEQPIQAADRFWLAGDIRLDNREEIISVVRRHLPPAQQEQPTDAALVLASYQQWGSDCARQIIGDFAFALWDSREQVLFCARDPMGVRQFAYCVDEAEKGPRLLFATTAGIILAGLNRVPSVNRPLLEEMLGGRYERWVGETAYQGILRLPAGHTLTVRDGRIRCARYWAFGTAPSERLRTDADYIARFRELFENSVRARLRSQSPVGIVVSGGLDSSSVASTAGRLASRSPARARLYSAVFEKTPHADEREYLRAVIDEYPDLPARTILGDDGWALREFGGEDGYPMDEPEIDSLRYLMVRLLRQARQDDCRVVLSGHWGDQVLTAYPYHGYTTLRDVSIFRLGRELRHFHHWSGRSIAWLLFYRLLRPLLPTGIGNWVGRWPLLARTFGLAAPRKGLGSNPERMDEERPSPPRLRSECARLCYNEMVKAMNAARLVAWDTMAAHVGVEWRFPFLDRRLIDFMLVLPPHLVFRDGLIKYVLRTAMEGILPRKVQQRATFAHTTELVDRGLFEKERPRIRALLQDSRVVRAGMLPQDGLETAWQTYWQDASASPFPMSTSGLEDFLCVETWLRFEETTRNNKRE